MAVVVFGARGFLGRSVVPALRGAGLEVVESERPDVAARLAGERLLPIDLNEADPGSIAAELRGAGARAVVNCSGLTAGEPAELERANVAAVARLLDALALAAPRGGGPAGGDDGRLRLVQIGSAAEYGRGPEGVPVREDAPAEPLSAYGVTKLAGTALVVAATRRGHIDGVVLRVFNAVGPGMPATSLPGAITRRLAAALAERADRIEMGPLGAVRDFIDVRDIASAVAAAAAAPALPHPVLNVGSGAPHTARDLVLALAARLRYEGRIVETSSSASTRSADVPWQVADIALARRTLGWRPVHDLAALVDALAADVAPIPG